MSPLITPAELAALVERGEVTVLDVRWRLPGQAPEPYGPAAYREGHIPTAVFCDLDTDLAAPPGPGGRHPLPAAETLQAAARRLGVSHAKPVVAYDDADSTAAARAWWTLRYFGHGDVRVLDGGIRAWREAGLPLSKDAERARPGDFTAKPGALPILEAAEAAALAAEGVLLDARAPERYRGENEPVDPVAGRIPGAVNAPTGGNVGGDGRFLTPPELRDRFAELGADGSVPVGAYCGSGVTAAHEVLALDLAGVPASLYIGSWSHWITDPDRPVETG
ncbi:thiosulfate/3-mercaptopyruvate sulfurtransferase [Sinosporangium album]|uniref:Thiosulfate/3-mercaptopyruvate sulfurtransferase n=1 Tax=Sinosporangium album TaxID=504805 RepID=A0A1G7TEA6_9ACTN|nr:sulfurtransferase [Sinosporangium album]SDG33575.1 thiosulfate/3-mercaptopyruvate sulfurtransferase [Sinosporangium album]